MNNNNNNNKLQDKLHVHLYNKYKTIMYSIKCKY